MIQPLSIEAHGRKVEFKIDLDPSFVVDQHIAWYLNQGIPCEPEVVRFMMKVVRPGDFVVDGGANVGFFTLLLAALVGESGSVLAIEPGENNLPKLRANIEINGILHASIEPCVLAATSSQIQFYTHDDSGLNACFPSRESRAGNLRNCVSLGALLGERVPRLIKLDIEGSELEALQGLSQRPPFIVCELNPKALVKMGASPSLIQLFMLQRGYGLYRLPFEGGIPARIPETSELKIERENTNVLFALPRAFDELWNQVEL